MPFTLSHPALTLPLAKRLPVIPLFLGAMAPDFEYFLRLKLLSVYTHTLSGGVFYDLPLTFLVFQLLKRSLRKRCLVSQAFMMNPLDFALAALLGIYSHLFWDGFTHSGGLFVQYFPVALKQPVFQGIPLYKALQHFTTLIGAGLVFQFVRKQRRLLNWLWSLLLAASFRRVFVLMVFALLAALGTLAPALNLGGCVLVLLSSIFLAFLITARFTSAASDLPQRS